MLTYVWIYLAHLVSKYRFWESRPGLGPQYMHGSDGWTGWFETLQLALKAKAAPEYIFGTGR